MRGLFEHSFICILALVAFPRCPGQTRAISETGDGPRITVRTYDYVKVAPETLREAQQEAERTFRLEGIEIVWLDDPRKRTETARDQSSAGVAGEPATLYITILPRSMAQHYPEHKKSHAFGFGASPSAQGFASIFFHRVKEMARRKDASTVTPSLAGLLGHVMAHEIAHALGCPHASTGLMRKEWSLRELTQVTRREFLFTSRQGEFLRTQARERSKRRDITP